MLSHFIRKVLFTIAQQRIRKRTPMMFSNLDTLWCLSLPPAASDTTFWIRQYQSSNKKSGYIGDKHLFFEGQFAVFCVCVLERKDQCFNFELKSPFLAKRK